MPGRDPSATSAALNSSPQSGRSCPYQDPGGCQRAASVPSVATRTRHVVACDAARTSLVCRTMLYVDALKKV